MHLNCELLEVCVMHTHFTHVLELVAVGVQHDERGVSVPGLLREVLKNVYLVLLTGHHDGTPSFSSVWSSRDL